MMRFIGLIPVVIIVAFVLVQVCIPMMLGRKIFPWFREENDLKDELAAIAQQLHEAELKREIKKSKTRLADEIEQLSEPDKDEQKEIK